MLVELKNYNLYRSNSAFYSLQDGYLDFLLFKILLFFRWSFIVIKMCSGGSKILAPTPINFAWWAELNDTTLDFLAPPEHPKTPLPVDHQIFKDKKH